MNHKDIPGKMRMDYAHGIRDQNLRNLEGLQNLLTQLRKSQFNVEDLLKASADMIWRQFGIDNVAIGLRDPKDGLYKYRVMVGFREDALEGHKSIGYRKEQFFDDGHFISTEISKLSRLYLTEDNVLSEDERKTFNRPGLLEMTRRTITDSLEGDYIDTKILGSNDELLGWIEISGTRTMQLPDSATIRWVETIAMIIGAALMCQSARKG